MFSLRQQSQKKVTSWISRNFGHGHHYKRKEIFKKSENTIYKVPTEEGDLHQVYGKNNNNIFHHRLIGKFLTVFKAHRLHQMDNARTEKNSAYYWFPRIPMLANSLFLRIMATVFDRNRQHVGSVYDEPVQIHENSIFLYKSPDAPEWIGCRFYDYFAFSFLIYGTCISSYPLLWLPVLPYLAEFPKFFNQ